MTNLSALQDAQSLLSKTPKPVQWAIFGGDITHMKHAGMQQVANALRETGQTCTELACRAQSAYAAVAASTSNTAIAGPVLQFVAALTGLADVFLSLADQTEITSADDQKNFIESAFFAFYTLCELTFFTSSGTAPLAVARLAARHEQYVAIRHAFLAKIIAVGTSATTKRAVLFAAGFGLGSAGLDWAIQEAQINDLPGFAHRDELDTQSITLMGVQGAAAVLAGTAGASLLGARATKLLGRAALPTVAAASGLAGAVGGALATAAVTGQFDFTLSSVVGGITQGIAGGLVAQHTTNQPPPHHTELTIPHDQPAAAGPSRDHVDGDALPTESHRSTDTTADIARHGMNNDGPEPSSVEASPRSDDDPGTGHHQPEYLDPPERPHFASDETGTVAEAVWERDRKISASISRINTLHDTVAPLIDATGDAMTSMRAAVRESFETFLNEKINDYLTTEQGKHDQMVGTLRRLVDRAHLSESDVHALNEIIPLERPRLAFLLSSARERFALELHAAGRARLHELDAEFSPWEPGDRRLGKLTFDVIDSVEKMKRPFFEGDHRGRSINELIADVQELRDGIPTALEQLAERWRGHTDFGIQPLLAEMVRGVRTMESTSTAAEAAVKPLKIADRVESSLRLTERTVAAAFAESAGRGAVYGGHAPQRIAALEQAAGQLRTTLKLQAPPADLTSSVIDAIAESHRRATAEGERELAPPLGAENGHPRIQRSYLKDDYIKMWENKIGRKLSSRELIVLDTGCYGVTTLRFDTVLRFDLQHRDPPTNLAFGDLVTYGVIAEAEQILAPGELANGVVNDINRVYQAAQHELMEARTAAGATDNSPTVVAARQKVDNLEQTLNHARAEAKKIWKEISEEYRKEFEQVRETAKREGGHRTFELVSRYVAKFEAILATKPADIHEFMQLVKADDELALLQDVDRYLPDGNPAEWETIIFSKHIWSGQGEYEPNPDRFAPDATTGQIDMSGDKFKGKHGYIKFDYAWYDPVSKNWWHANHAERPEAHLRERDPMLVLQSSHDKFFTSYLEFDTAPICIGFARRK